MSTLDPQLDIELSPFRSRPLLVVLLWGVVVHEWLHATAARQWGTAEVGWLPAATWWHAPAACAWVIDADVAPEWADRAIHGAPFLALPVGVAWSYLAVTVAASGVSLVTAAVLAWSIANSLLVGFGGRSDLAGALRYDN
jgi:hypothetical protein